MYSLNCITLLNIGKFYNIKLLRFQMSLNAFSKGVLSSVHFPNTPSSILPSALTLQFHCSCVPSPV